MSVSDKERVENELGFAFMAVNLRKYIGMTAYATTDYKNNPTKKGSVHQKTMIGTFFI